MKLVRACASLGMAAASLLLSAGPGMAGPVEHTTEHFDVTFVADNLCGSALSPDGHSVGSFTEVVRSSSSGAPMFFDNFVGETTFTLDGTSVTVQFGGPMRDAKITDNGDGTITILGTNSGLFGRITDAAGNEVFAESGHALVEFVIDVSGTIADPDDDVLLSVTPLAEAGRHPGDFCEALIGALTA
jgi:hypothetical protein